MLVSFGRLAHQLGLMNLDQIVEILRAQENNPRRFGALALEKGYLTEEQVETILETQRDSRLPLGQVIATLGLVDPETLDRELRLYLETTESNRR